jgi:aryl-alcohol dehydrogenase-like predicted oxidoreductase
MEGTYKNLGKSGVKVSPVCLGTMTFDREADQDESFRIMDYFVEQGYNFLDTANAYSLGKSEAVVGRWMKERANRQGLVIATKVYGKMGEGPNEGGLSRLHILQAVEDSLRRLQTDFVDLYQIHRWDPTVPPEETLAALDDLVRQGKVRYIGCSNLKAWHLGLFLNLADTRLLSRFVCIQPIYNALSRAIELEVLPLCKVEGIGVISYNPLAGGVLTGKYKRGDKLPEGTRLQENTNYYERYYTEQTFDIVEDFVAHARERGVTPAQLALAWVMAEDRVTAPILGARSLEQLKDSLQGANTALSEDERKAVPAIRSGFWVGMEPVYDRV